MNEKILEAIKKSRESKKRNFKQSFDLAINLASIDLKKPENKIKADLTLPHGFGRPVKVGVIADMLLPQAKNLGESIVLIRKDEIETLGKDKKAVKNLAEKCRYFVAEAPLMPLVGRYFGQVFATRNKMPTPIPPTTPNLKLLIEKYSKTVRITLKDSPVIHVPVGFEEMEDEKVAENVEAVINSVIATLPKGKENVKNFFIKLTMGSPVKFIL